MASDWMQIDLDLPQKAEVLRLAAETGLGIEEVVGRVVCFWAWVERNGVDGLVRHATTAVVARVVNADATFVAVLADVGWVEFSPDGAAIPGWEKRFSRAAKQRSCDARRKSNGRTADGSRTQAGQNTDTSRTQAGQVADESPLSAGRKPGTCRTTTGRAADEKRTNSGPRDRVRERVIPPPPPLPPPSQKLSAIQPPPDPEWAEAEADLLSAGLGTAPEAVRACVAAGCEPVDVRRVLSHWRFKAPAWGVGGLAHRLGNLRRNQDPADPNLWPPPAATPADAKAEREQAAADAKADRIAARKRASEARAEQERLERDHGAAVDAMDRAAMEAVLDERVRGWRKLYALTDSGKHAKGAVRFELLTHWARHAAPQESPP